MTSYEEAIQRAGLLKTPPKQDVDADVLSIEMGEKNMREATMKKLV